MIIELNDKMKIADLNHLFIQQFPFLKLSFYNQPKNLQGESFSYHLLDSNLNLIKCTESKSLPGEIEIHFWHKTNDVENQFKKKFGLNVQIHRRNGDEWVQTVGTDGLMLEEQNKIGKQSVEKEMHSSILTFEQEKKI